MEFLNYEEQAIIKMYSFESKEELKLKLENSLENIEDEDLKETTNKLISKIESFTLEDLRNIDNIFE